MKKDQSLIEFPCDFQIKVIGVNKDSFTPEIMAIARQYYPETKDSAIRQQPSGKGNYLSLTLTIHAQDQKTLDDLYLELTKHPDIKMVL